MKFQGTGSFLRAMRPALLGATICSLLPVSISNGSWRLCSVPAARSAILFTALLAMYLFCIVTRHTLFIKFSSAVDVFNLIQFFLPPLRWVGIFIWVWKNASRLESFLAAFLHLEVPLQTALLKGNVPQLRRLARQHGHITRLAGVFCGTFGGMLAAYVYITLIEFSASIYMNIQLTQPLGPQGLVELIFARLMAPLPVVLLHLTTNAGYQATAHSQRAADRVREHLLTNSATREDTELTEILNKLEQQQATMNMSGYFVLGRELFIQSMKDIVTLVIALAQFDMAAPAQQDKILGQAQSNVVADSQNSSISSAE
ncbi:hypothetical protein FJT64_025317 [Amphibalanus amphitrite]|uniref:Uncharacterized protein n=1 Tax=Amphibalanus amphitrite TaxID=1232801 RepID=A0A6A4W5I7_AMPAM|nr:hypothetical protein FJT64_025317 [Amphibalanus amphitrite]